MKTPWFLLLLVAIALPLPAQEAKIEVSPAEHDFGRLVDGAKARTEFRIANAGEAELVIEKVTASCGCTVPLPESQRIAPGSDTAMKVEFDSAGRSGPWRGSVTIYSNDPSRPRSVVQLRAEIVPEVRISETYLYFGEVFRGTTETREIVLENVMYDDLAIEKYHVEGDHFSVEKVEDGVGERGGKAVFRLRVDEDAPYGYSEGNFYIRTNYARNPLFRVFLIVRVKGYVDLSRPRIDFGILVRGPGLTGRKEKVSLYSHRETIEVKSVRTDLPYLDVSIETVSAGRSFNVILEIRDGNALAAGEKTFPARVQGVLEVRTTSTERPVIELPIQMIVKTED